MTIQEADYIVIGAGSAGCVMANRLSADLHCTVALFEAGCRDQSWTIHMPAALTYNLENTRYNWNYHTEPEAALQQRQLYWPRGKVLGGSSSLNAMVYIRGHAKDYDRWHAEGALGWYYDNVLPYFRRSENFSGGADFYRGDAGPLRVIDRISENPLFDAFIAAGVEAGYPYTADVNGRQQEGFGRFDMTIHEGKRCSAAVAYLHSVKQRRNLHCYTRAHVLRILTSHGRATGIEYLYRGKKHVCHARREVIVSAGALQSPHLLMLSGLGPAELLRQQAIEVVVDLPGVGQNLQDHLEFYMQYECKRPITLNQMRNPLRRAGAGMQWFLSRSGLCASSHLEAGAFINSRHNVEHPDLQYHFLPGVVNNHGRDFGKVHAFQVHVGTMRPESRGYVRLVSNNPLVPVKVHANYLQTDADLRDLMAAVPLTRDIFSQAALRPYKGKEIQPGIDCQSLGELAAFVKQKADSAYHPCGTCKMGVDTMAVVNPEARVYGIDNLRVVDASIMPSIISGNLNAPIIMMAERISDLMLARRQER